MASSSSFSEDLTCSVCLIIFTDPVTLFCGHSFCRECITLSVKSLNQCPQCRATVPTDRMDFTTNHILKSLAEKAKKEKESGKYPEAAVGFCPEHDEKLKLFCVTDQQLSCIICRDCERHEGHKFKPVKEAAASIRKEVETLVEKESSDICAIEHLAESQNEEIRKSKEKSQKLRIQISSQFQEMHQFLKRREDEILNELKNKEKAELKKMRQSLNVVEKALTEGREVGEQMKSVLEVTEPEGFLKSWSESKMTPKPKSNPKGSNLKVVTSSLSLGHYESHLQLFVWKEMRQMIQPQAERLLFKSQDPFDLSQWSSHSCSCQRSCYSCGRSNGYYNSSCNCDSNFHTLLSQCQNYYQLQTTNTVNINQIAPGPHYWEIDVEDKNCWTVQIKNHSLTCKDDKFTTTHKTTVKEVKLANKPKKIGFYLNGNSEELHFFDADTMQHVEVA
ncbi:nuclear factor 7, brain-like [Poecilia reticulata]|uniref:nuclear factor 7, brain-like n=1 Tax=Poecilia reticulata TaxID=8081 RepID=UPI0007E93E45|nr:PREDICTED: nuclear factor 7, brain-like [Poecilia reticulata]